MSDELTLMLNDKKYALSDEFKRRIEERAEREFSENWFFDYHWEENARGDPILCIETTGEWVPYDRLEKLEFEMQEVEQQQGGDSDSDETEEIDAGNGMKSVPRDEVDMNPGDGPASHPDEEEAPDTSFMITHPSNNYVPQPEQEDPDKVPPHPEELPEDPTYVTWIPDNGCTEVWETGRALVPLELNVEWNVQLRADEAPDGATKIVPDDDGHVSEVPKTNRHDDFERMARETDCDVVATEQPSDQPDTDSSQQSYQGREPDETLDGKYGGTNWHV